MSIYKTTSNCTIGDAVLLPMNRSDWTLRSALGPATTGDDPAASGLSSGMDVSAPDHGEPLPL